MNEVLYHHGIKGMKWGVRRTPAQLGYATAKKAPEGTKQQSKNNDKRTPGKSVRKSTSISDDELQKRIARLNMEERYDDLVARKNLRENTGFKATAKRLLGNAAEDLGRQLLGKAVSKMVDRIAGDKKFDIDEYKNMDVNNMDSDTIAKVAKWYGDASKISAGRSTLEPTTSSSTTASNNGSTSSPKPNASSSTDYSKRPSWGTQTKSKSSQKKLDDWIKQRNRAMKDLGR